MGVSQGQILAVAYRRLTGQPDGSHPDAAPDHPNFEGQDFAHKGRRVEHKLQSGATELLLRDLLHLSIGDPPSHWKLTRNQSGKPALTTLGGPSCIDVSLSHSGPLALAGITDLGQIGVDVELRDPRRSISEVAAYAFGPHEQRMVESDGMRAFYRIWTLREALSKACGVGFPILADRRDYFSEAPESGVWHSVIDSRRWLFWTGELADNYTVAVAIALRSPYSPDRMPNLTPLPL